MATVMLGGRSRPGNGSNRLPPGFPSVRTSWFAVFNACTMPPAASPIGPAAMARSAQDLQQTAQRPARDLPGDIVALRRVDVLRPAGIGGCAERVSWPSTTKRRPCGWSGQRRAIAYLRYVDDAGKLLD